MTLQQRLLKLSDRLAREEHLPQIAQELREIAAALMRQDERFSLQLSVNRCAVCGWPLVVSVEDGCVRGNCSLRPRPKTLYDPHRAVAEAVK